MKLWKNGLEPYLTPSSSCWRRLMWRRSSWISAGPGSTTFSVAIVSVRELLHREKSVVFSFIAKGALLTSIYSVMCRAPPHIGLHPPPPLHLPAASNSYCTKKPDNDNLGPRCRVPPPSSTRGKAGRNQKVLVMDLPTSKSLRSRHVKNRYIKSYNILLYELRTCQRRQAGR
jgi:hypothetical protein